MTPKEQQQIQESLKTVASILYRHTPEEKLEDFETIEQTVRDYILTEIAPPIGEIFFTQATPVHQAELEKLKVV